MALDKPIILVSNHPSIINHPLYLAKVNWIFDNFDDALDVIHGVFEDYVKEPVSFTQPAEWIDMSAGRSSPCFIQDEI